MFKTRLSKNKVYFIKKKTLISEQEKNIILDNLSEVISFIDRDFIIKWTNKASLSTFNKADNEVIGQYCYNRHDSDTNCDNCPVKKVFLTGKTVNSNVETNLGKFLQITANPVFDKNNNIIGAIEIVKDISEQKYILLFENQVQLQDLIDNMPSLICIKDSQSRFVQVNKNYARACGYEIEKILGKTDFDIWPEEIAKKNKNDDIEILNLNKNIAYEENVDFANGKRWMETHKFAIKDKNGEIVGTIGISRDITERKITQQKLLHKDKILSAVADATNELITNQNFNQAVFNSFKILGENLNIGRIYLFENYIDEISKKLLARQINEWCASGIEAQANNPDYQKMPVYTESFSTIISSRKPFSCIVKDLNENIRKFYEAKNVKSVMMFPIFIRDDFWGFIGFNEYKFEKQWSEIEQAVLLTYINAIIGVIERNQNQKTIEESLILLKEKEDLERLIMESTDNGYILFDQNENIVYTNSKFYEMLNLPEHAKSLTKSSEIRRSIAEQLINAEEFMQKSEELLLSSKDTYNLLKLKNGRILQRYAVPLFKENQKVGYVVNYRDITERKKAEIEILKAKELAESTSIAKSNFLANMSHEIRTPLNGVLGFIQLLVNTELNEEQKDFIEEAQKSSKLLLNIINDILDFSKIEAGKMTINSTKFDLPSTIEDVVVLSSMQAFSKGVEVNFLIQSDIPQFVSGDPSRLEQILINLIANAIKFTTKGEVKIIVSVKSTTDTTVKINFDIIDTGIGIPKNKLENIFEAFNQGDPSATRKYGGTGLGLTICKKLIDMMNGKIHVTSEEGKGSIFSFNIDFLKENESKKFTSFCPCIDGHNILIADENNTNLNIMEYYLKEAGCIVHKATCIEQVEEFLKNKLSKNENYNSIIIDYKLLNGDEFNYIKSIKNNPKTSDIPLVMTTSLTKKGDIGFIKEKGFNGYITKPIKKQMLLDCIATVTRNKKCFESKTEDLSIKQEIKKEKFCENINILVVEDNKMNQKLVLKMLEHTGFNCDIVFNGKEAVEAYQNNNYNIILMDCQMPVLDGYQATKQIREIEANLSKHIPIIALTAHSLEGDIEKCLNAGMDYYLSKPVCKDKLIETINTYLIPEIQPSSFILSREEKIISELMNEVGLNREEAKEFLNEYLDLVPSVIKQISAAVNNENYDEIFLLSHSLKGSSSNLRIHEIRNLALELEKASNSQNLLKCSMLLSDICKIVQDLKQNF